MSRSATRCLRSVSSASALRLLSRSPTFRAEALLEPAVAQHAMTPDTTTPITMTATTMPTMIPVNVRFLLPR